MSDGLAWSKSSYSDSEGGNCVEVAISSNATYVRDSKDTAGLRLTVTPDAWQTLVAAVGAEL